VQNVLLEQVFLKVCQENSSSHIIIVHEVQYISVYFVSKFLFFLSFFKNYAKNIMLNVT